MIGESLADLYDFSVRSKPGKAMDFSGAYATRRALAGETQDWDHSLDMAMKLALPASKAACLKNPGCALETPVNLPPPSRVGRLAL